MTSIFLRGTEHKSEGKYKGDLPRGISFSCSRTEIHERLGTPDWSGGGDSVPGLGRQPVTDRYDYDSYKMWLSYSEKETAITEVTIQGPSTAQSTSE